MRTPEQFPPSYAFYAERVMGFATLLESLRPLSEPIIQDLAHPKLEILMPNT